jgi:putative solute:sodium symporter small subunit
MIIDEEQKRLHLRRSKRVVAAAVVLLAAIAIAVPVLAPLLKTHVFLRFPMDYFLIAHGMVFAVMALVYWFISAEERADREINIITPL